ncbi:T9SS type A sorting domain-containing protein [bacterium]|nr:T9SS type A sorting domain-containing protein [bacterium]
MSIRTPSPHAHAHRSRIILVVLAWLVASVASGDTIHDGGTIDGPVVWSSDGNDHVVTGSITIAAGGSLTIEDGCTVRFAASLAIHVHGTLTADGTADAGIVFTQRHDGERWHGLQFRAGSSGTLRHCTIEHASQYTSSAGVVASSASPVLEDCTLRSNRQGLYVDEGAPHLVRCTITDNSVHGVRLEGASVPTFGGSLDEWNDIHGNGDDTPDRDLHNGTADIVARYVYWGTIVATEIEDRIHHDPDDASLGLVQYWPWTDAAHENQYGSIGVDDAPDLPTAFALALCAPNPFNPATTIRYDLPRTCAVRLVVHDVRGRLVATLVDEVQAAVHRSVRWDARGLASGTYVYSLAAGDFRQSRKLLLLR